MIVRKTKVPTNARYECITTYDHKWLLFLSKLTTWKHNRWQDKKENAPKLINFQCSQCSCIECQWKHGAILCSFIRNATKGYLVYMQPTKSTLIIMIIIIPLPLPLYCLSNLIQIRCSFLMFFFVLCACVYISCSIILTPSSLFLCLCWSVHFKEIVQIH